MAFPDLLVPTIEEYDIDGTKGCNPFPRRSNLLVDVSVRLMTEDHLQLSIKQTFPEGFGVQAYFHDFLTVPGDLQGDADLILIWDAQVALPPRFQKIWLWQVVPSEVDVCTFCYDDLSRWFFADNEGNLPQGLQHVEMFSGGVGGWSVALKYLTNEIQMPSRSIGIEIDPTIAKTFAVNHSAAYVCPKHDLPENFFDCYPGNWVICDDICSNFWVRAVSQLQIDLITISSPCGPWSSASTGLGLDRPEGSLMLHAILKCRFLRPSYIAIENVAGFAMHSQKHLIEKAIRWIGYRLLWQKTVDVRACMGLTRARWIALAVRVHAKIPIQPFPTWHLPTTPVDHAPCLKVWPESIRQELAITAAVYKVAADPNKASKHSKTKTHQEILQDRTYSNTMMLPTFMALYGSQHELSQAHLDERSYLGFFLQDSTMPHGARFFHPAEVTMLHGTVDWMFIPHDMKQAWLTTGNSILPVHAMIPLIAVLNSFLEVPIATHEAVRAFLQRRLTMNNAQVFLIPQGQLYTKDDIFPNQAFLDSLQSLHDMEETEHLQVWIPQIGIRQTDMIEPTHIDPLDTSQDALSVISVPSASDTEHPTHVVLQAQLSGAHFQQSFWFASDLPAIVLEAPWYHAFASSFPDLCVLPGITTMTPRPCPVDFGNPYKDVLVQILMDHHLTLLKMDHDVAIQDHAEVSALGEDLFDQFAKLDPQQRTADHTVVMTHEVLHGTYHGNILQLLASLELCKGHARWNPDNDSFSLSYTGDPTCTATIAAFWTSVLPQDMQTAVGRTVTCSHASDAIQIHFMPCRTHGVMPPVAFAVQIAVLAFRSLLHAMNRTLPQDQTRPICIKWTCRPLFHDSVSDDMTIAMIIKTLLFALMPVTGDVPHRIVHEAKQVMPEAFVRDLTIHPRRNAAVLHTVLQMHGGGGAKNQHKMLTQTAIASYLLEMGFELSWVSQTVETLTNRLNLQKLQHFSSLPASSQKVTALKALLTEVQITMPEVPKAQTKKPPMGLPWNQPKRRKGDGDINPADFDLLESFFKNQDGTPCAQVSAIRPQTTGVCMLSSRQAEPWLSATDKISSDELGLLVVGKPPQTAVQGEDVVVPCRNLDGHMVLIHCKLYQLGSKAVTYQKGDPKQISADNCSLIAITLHKEDFPAEQWTEALQRTVPYIRQVLEQENLADHVLSIWGRSLRQGKSPCSPQQATTIQVHCSVPDDKLHKILMKSGFNKLFCTPKNAMGRLNTGYQVIWLNCDSCQAAVSSAKLASPLGLVRGRKTLGIRVRDTDFDEAWKVLCPQQPLPTKQAGEHVYRIDGLPFGVTLPTMKQWCDKISWKAQPIRALGPQSMLLRTDDAPPDGLHMFNSQVVLIRWLPPRMPQTGPLMVGPKASKTREHVDIDDPWARWQGPKPAGPPVPNTGRTIDGPTEMRLQAQDKKLEGLENQLKHLAVSQDTMMRKTDERFQAAELREKQHIQHVSHAMDSLKMEVAKSLDVSFQKNTQMMDERMAELKHLLLSQKRPAPDSHAMDD